MKFTTTHVQHELADIASRGDTWDLRHCYMTELDAAIVRGIARSVHGHDFAPIYEASATYYATLNR